jgi:hypothetical protein
MYRIGEFAGKKIQPQIIYLPFMKSQGITKPLLICTGYIFVTLVVVSLFDVVLTALYIRFYSNAAFIVIFGVGGIFAAVLGYQAGMDKASVKNEMTRWSLVSLIVLLGLLFFFFLAKLEGGEYEAAFKAFGITMALTCLLFIKEKLQ